MDTSIRARLSEPGKIGDRNATQRPAPARVPPPGATAAGMALRLLNSYPYGVVVARRGGRIIARNAAAERLLSGAPEDAVLCDVLGCRPDAGRSKGVCLIEGALEQGAALPEVRIELPARCEAPAAWITVAPLEEAGDCVIVELRPVHANDRRPTTPDWTAGRLLRISALGRTRIESAEGVIGGPWLSNRAGHVLKYLITERHRVVSAEEILEAVWADAGRHNLSSVRYHIHQLRQHLEPDRPVRGESSFIARVGGGYVLRRESVVVDVDEFERHIATGLSAADAGDADRARRELERGLSLYGGEFLADEPYAEWAIPERHRLRAVAGAGLHALAELHTTRQDLGGAAAALERLAELEPYDADVHRRLIALALRRGRRSEALRRYNALRRRMISTFGEDLEFTLSDVASA